MITLSDNTGRSFDDAIVISGAMNTEEGVAAEYEYLVEEFGFPDIDWFFIKQMLIPKKDKYFDKFILKNMNGIVYDINFEVTEFFAK